MDIRRVLKSTYELLDKTDIVRLAKSAFRDVATLGLSTRLLDGSGDLITTPVFLGGALEPSADGATALISLKPGLALWYNSGEADEWLGEVTPVFTETAQTVAFATNTDGSGDDRIDVLSVRPLSTDEDLQTRKFKDPTTNTVYQQDSPQRTRLAFEFVVTVGVAAPVPAAPATPAGTFKIAEVLRVNSQVNVNAVDLTDSRQLDRVRAGIVEGLAGIAARAGAVYFGDPDGDHYRLERDSDTAPTILRLRNQLGSAIDFEPGDLKLASNGNHVAANHIRAKGDSGDLLEGVIDIFNEDASKYGMAIAANLPLAWGSFIMTGGILVAQDHFGMGGTSTKTAVGRYKVEFDSGVWGAVLTNAGAVQATCNALSTGAAAPLVVVASLATDGAAYGGGGGTVVDVEFYSFAGALTDPAATFELALTCSILPTP